MKKLELEVAELTNQLNIHKAAAVSLFEAFGSTTLNGIDEMAQMNVKDKEVAELKLKNQDLLDDLEESNYYSKSLRAEINSLKQKNSERISSFTVKIFLN